MTSYVSTSWHKETENKRMLRFIPSNQSALETNQMNIKSFCHLLSLFCKCGVISKVDLKVCLIWNWSLSMGESHDHSCWESTRSPRRSDGNHSQFLDLIKRVSCLKSLFNFPFHLCCGIIVAFTVFKAKIIRKSSQREVVFYAVVLQL